MSGRTIQDYVNILSHPHTIFWDGHCQVGKQRPRIRLALTAKKTGALGVLFFADSHRNAWLFTSGLTASVIAGSARLTGTSGYVLKLKFSRNSATGSLSFEVLDKGHTQRRRVAFPVQMTQLTAPPGRPSVNADTSLPQFLD